MAKDYIPAKLADYRPFSDHFVDLVSQKAAAWGIPDTAKTPLTSGHAAWTAAQAEADNPDTRTSIAIEKARRLRREDTAKIRWMVNTFINPNASGAITVEDRFDLGLHVKDTTPSHHPAPGSRPDTDVEPSGKFQHTVIALDSATSKKEKPPDAYGVRYAWQLGGTAPATPADLPKSKFSRKTQEKFSWDPGDQGKPVHYATAYENSKGEQGPWSAIVSTIVP
ncbi:hypothetical protein Holit_01360 [Hollandina sp. SP2]